MLRVALRNLIAHKLRLFLITLAIVMGVGFVAGTYIFTDSISRTFSGIFDDVYSGIDLTVRPEATEFGSGELSFDESVIDDVLAVEGVRSASPEAGGFAQFIDNDGNPIGGNGPPALGFSWSDEPELNVIRIKDGNGEAPDGPGEVVVDVNTAELNGFSVGDTISVQTLGPVEEFTIVGLASFGEADSLAGATLAIFELREAQRLFDLEGQVSFINIKVEGDADIETVRQRIEMVVPDNTEIATGEEQTNEQQDELNEGLGFLNIFLLVFAGVGIFVGGFIIQNTYRIIVSQRSKELALLRAVGATRRQVTRIVLYEAVVTGILASIIGIFAGVLISEGVRAAGNAAGFGLPDGEFAVLPRTILVSFAVGVGVTTLSALIPAIKASRVSPVEALRDNESSSAQRSLKRRGIFSVILIALGGGVLSFGLFGSIASPIYYVGFGVVLLFLGVSSFAPLLTRPIATIVGFPFAKLRGMPGRLAQDNTVRTPRSTSSTAAALMIGTSLVVLVSIFASSVNSTIEQTFADSFPADITATPINPDPEQSFVPNRLVEELRELDELRSVAAFVSDVVGIDGEGVFISAVDVETFDDVIKLEPQEGAIGRLSGGMLVQQDYLTEQGWEIGQVIEIEFVDEQFTNVPIAGTFETQFDADILVDRTVHTEANGEPAQASFVSATYNLSYDSEDARAAVESVADRYPSVEVQDQDEFIGTIRDQINGILGLFWALLGFAIIIAVIGIVITLALSIAERKRELGLLRAVGMTKRQVRTMVRAEAIIISLFGTTLGIVMGIFFAWAMLEALEDEGLTGFVIPTGQLVLYYVLGAFAGVVASVWPSYSAAKVDILDALDFE